MKKIAIVAVLIIIPILVAFISSSYLLNPISDSDTFYIGVTYCGESVDEAKTLIDRVKNYTNLFVLQSGPLQNNPEKINKIGNYAIDSKMNFIIYFGSDSSYLMKTWLDKYDGGWKDKFLGIYFGDEPAGKMLDGDMVFHDLETQKSLRKMTDSSSCWIHGYQINNSTSVDFWMDGKIQVTIHHFPTQEEIENNTSFSSPFFIPRTDITYFSNGTTVVVLSEDENLSRVADNYELPYTYEELWNIRPIQSYDETADRFIQELNSGINKYGPKEFCYFTSDYLLYWFDYKAGYDVLLAQFGWNHTIEQDIALVRGAGSIQNKSWGTIITWKYNHPPYLDSGEAIYDQMKTAYESGAKYVVIFNYSENMTGAFGTLQEEHFEALELFWKEVVNNPEVKQNSILAETALVLPKNYGWGMRYPNDKIWGLWEADEKAEQIWSLRSSLLEKYGLRLDIVYGDSELRIEDKYSNIFYWNQTT
jgi:hypothetical protein